MKTTMEIQAVTILGKRAVRVVVRNATPALRIVCDAVGIVPVQDIANVRDRVCATQSDLADCQSALRPYAVGVAIQGQIELRG